MHQLGDAGVDELSAFLNIKTGLVDFDDVPLSVLIENDDFFIEVAGIVEMDVNQARFFFQFKECSFASRKSGSAFFVFEKIFLIIGIERDRDVGKPAAGAQLLLLEEFEDVFFIFRKEDIGLRAFAVISEFLAQDLVE